jgi:hypothetical protein
MAVAVLFFKIDDSTTILDFFNGVFNPVNRPFRVVIVQTNRVPSVGQTLEP